MIKNIFVIAAVVSVAVGHVQEHDDEPLEPTEISTQMCKAQNYTEEILELDDEPIEPTEIITRMCKLQNETRNIPIVQDKLEKFIDCFYNLFEPKEKDFAAFMPLNVEKHCAKSELLKTCIEDFSNVLLDCLIHEDFGYMTNNAGIGMVLNYLCLESPPGNEVTDFALFFEDKGRDCFRKKFLQCTWNQEHKPDHVTEASIIFSVNDPCGDHSQMSSCLVTAVEQCASNKRPGRWPSSCCPINLQCYKPSDRRMK